MRKSNYWRLSDNIIVYLLNDNVTAFIACSESKSLYSNVERLIKDTTGYRPNNYRKIEINLSNFKIRFTDGFQIELQSDQLPNNNNNNWYLIKNTSHINTDTRYYFELITSIASSNGEFENQNFEVSFSEVFPKEVRFYCPEMSSYKLCQSETIRRATCELGNKTSKYIPGYRYDSTDKSIIYLGTYYTLLSKSNKYDFDLNRLSDVHLYIDYDSLESTEKTIEDVFKSRSLGHNNEDIKLMFDSKRYNSFGKILEGDVLDIELNKLTLLNNSITKNTSVSRHNYKNCDNFYKIILPMLLLNSAKDKLSCDAVLITKLKEVIKLRMFDLMLICFRLSQDTNPINTSSEKDNTKNLVIKFLESIEDPNLDRIKNYNLLFSLLGISLADIASDVILNWDLGNIKQDINSYLKYERYFYHSFPTISRYRVKSTQANLKVIKIEDTYGGGKLSSILLSMAENARINNGCGVTDYGIINIGTSSDPKEYCSFYITLSDLLDYVGENKLDASLEFEILSNEFYCIKVDADLHEQIK